MIIFQKKKMDKLGEIIATTTSKEDSNYEVENQFILRLPSQPAAALKSVVASGVLNLKDRLSIQLESDMKHGTVRFDNWILPAKIVDLPCVIESHKTLDKKNFYKTADICQIMICTEDQDEFNKDNDKKILDDKRLDGKDRRFIYPHGITPPLKNVRKKRFRKTLKKKTVDVPEIEKEVKRLFRQDNEAISVRYEVVDADDEKADSIKPINSNVPSPGNLMNTNSQSMDQYLVEHDLFGQVLSSSDDEDDTRANESDDLSRMSMGLNKGDESNIANSSSAIGGNYVTEFSKDMLMGSTTTISQSASNRLTQLEQEQVDMQTNESIAEAVASLEQSNTQADIQAETNRRSNNDSLLNRLSVVEIELADIEEKLRAQELQIASIENFALQQRLQKEINDLKNLETQKRKEHAEILSMLND